MRVQMPDYLAGMLLIIALGHGRSCRPWIFGVELYGHKTVGDMPTEQEKRYSGFL
jgi:hypothetical protein